MRTLVDVQQKRLNEDRRQKSLREDPKPKQYRSESENSIKLSISVMFGTPHLGLVLLCFSELGLFCRVLSNTIVVIDCGSRVNK